jgi:hypothetical protein
MRVYICGPMTGLTDNNYPEFHAMAAEWRAAGYEVENPAENPPPACGTWAGWMRLGIAQMMKCDGIFLLADWHKSKGATIERNLAVALGLHQFHQQKSTA